METTRVLAQDNDIDLSRIWEAVWSGRLFVVFVTALCTLAGGAYAIFATEWFKAEVVLAPASQQATPGGALAGLGGLSGLATLAGINLPNSGEQQPIAVLKSKDFAKEFITEMNIEAQLLLEAPHRSAPLDMRDAVQVFDRRVRLVNEDTRTKLVRLSIRWKDPETAALWANTFAKRLNERLRQQAAAEADRNVAYLQKEMTATSLVALQQSIGTMLQAEMQKLMLARGNEEFAFKVIDQAVPPKERDTPQRTLILIGSFLGGGLLSLLILAVRASFAWSVRR